ncbi:MAG: LysR family transcriptional regulator [Variovorax sp.]
MPFVRYTLRQLETFVTVADMKSFTAAADRLGLTNQATSQLIAELESTLSLRLFDRTTRSVALSSAGRDLLASAETVLRHAHAAERAADDVRNRAAGVVRVGAPLVLASTALPMAIRSYTVDRPRVTVRIKDHSVDSFIDAVVTGDVDLAVGPDRVGGPELLSRTLFDSPWVLWCAPQHPLAKRRVVYWADLHGENLVSAGRDHEHGVAQMLLSAPEGMRIAPVDVVNNISTAFGITSQGLAATLAPAYVGVLAKTFGLVMRRVTQPESIRKVCLYQSARRALLPAAAGFADYLTEWLPRWNKMANGGG